MASRRQVLTTSYPFAIDKDGGVVFFTGQQEDLGQTAYLVSLILSNLRSMSPLLESEEVHPTQEETKDLRKYFQYLATVAIAAEVGGPAWSFGFPRPDATGFLTKLSEIWKSLKARNGWCRPFCAFAPQRRSSRHLCLAGAEGWVAWIPIGGSPSCYG